MAQPPYKIRAVAKVAAQIKVLWCGGDPDAFLIAIPDRQDHGAHGTSIGLFNTEYLLILTSPNTF